MKLRMIARRLEDAEVDQRGKALGQEALDQTWAGRCSGTAHAVALAALSHEPVIRAAVLRREKKNSPNAKPSKTLRGDRIQRSALAKDAPSGIFLRSSRETRRQHQD